MDYKYIEQLLEKYWECETTLQEEDILRAFFQQTDIPAHLRACQPLFGCYRKEAGKKLPVEAEERVLAAIDQEEKIVRCLPLKAGFRFRPFYKAVGMVGIILTLSMAVQHSLQPADQAGDRTIYTEQTEGPDAPYIQMQAAPERQSATVSSMPGDTLNLLQVTPPKTEEAPQASQTNKGM